MKNLFRLIAGKKFYCDEKGILTKDTEGQYQEVPDTDTKSTEVEVQDAGIAEIEKMLHEARTSVLAKAEEGSAASQVKAFEAVEKLFESIAGAAAKNTKIGAGAAKASYDVDATLAKMKELKSGNIKSMSFEINSKADLDYLVKVTSEGANVGDGVIENERVAGISRNPVRKTFIEDIATVIPNIQGEALSFVEVVTESGAPLPTAELALIPQKDFLFAEFKAPLKKIAVINKHSVELLQDAPQLVAAIKGWLADDVNIVTDTQLLSGNGTGENLNGIFGQASVLNQAAIGTKRVPRANLYDVIRVALTKIAVAGKGSFTGTNVLLNPEDADALDLTKDSNGQYILPPFRSADGTTIKGARIVENVGVPVGTFLVGDFRKLVIGTKGGIEIEMTNSDGDDFKHDILSVKLRRRVASYVRANDNGAFWTGNIASVVGWLTAS